MNNLASDMQTLIVSASSRTKMIPWAGRGKILQGCTTAQLADQAGSGVTVTCVHILALPLESLVIQGKSHGSFLCLNFLICEMANIALISEGSRKDELR